MKRFLSSVAVTCILGGIDSAQAELICDPSPQNIEDAKICMQEFLGKTTELQQALQNNKHIGKMADCQGQTTKSNSTSLLFCG